MSALGARQHTAHVVELPNDPGLLSADYAKLIRRQADAVAAPIVMAHSGAGPLLPACARTLEARQHVRLAAWVPDREASIVEEFEPTPRRLSTPSGLARIRSETTPSRSPSSTTTAMRRVKWARGTRRLFLPRAVYDERIPLVAEIPPTYSSRRTTARSGQHGSDEGARTPRR